MRKGLGLLFFLISLAAFTYSQGGMQRQKGQVIFGDTAKVSGWIAGLDSAEQRHPSFVTLFVDSTTTSGRRIAARCLVKIVLDNGQRYLAAAPPDSGHLGIRSDALDHPLLSYYFMPLVLEGSFNIVKRHHGSHLDLYMLMESGDSLLTALLEKQSTQGHTMADDEHELPCHYLRALLAQFEFTDKWLAILNNKLAVDGLTCEQKVALINIALAGNEVEMIENGIHRWRLSLSGGATFNYNSLDLLMPGKYEGRAPVTGGFMFAEIGRKDLSNVDLSGGFGIGYKQHHFNGFYFNSLHFNVGGKMQWPLHPKFDILCRMLYGRYLCIWSGALAKHFSNPARAPWMPRRMQDAINVRGGIMTRRSNWEMGLNFTCVSELEIVSHRMNIYAFGIYAAKHFNFYLDKRSRKAKR